MARNPEVLGQLELGLALFINKVELDSFYCFARSFGDSPIIIKEDLLADGFDKFAKDVARVLKMVPSPTWGPLVDYINCAAVESFSGFFGFFERAEGDQVAFENILELLTSCAPAWWAQKKPYKIVFVR